VELGPGGGVDRVDRGALAGREHQVVGSQGAGEAGGLGPDQRLAGVVAGAHHQAALGGQGLEGGAGHGVEHGDR
jgi:hypothetical protein